MVYMSCFCLITNTHLHIFVAASTEIKRKNVEGILEPTRAQNIGKICICKILVMHAVTIH